MAKQSYQNIRYQLIKEETRLLKQLGYELEVIKRDLSIMSRFEGSKVLDTFHLTIEMKFANIMKYFETRPGKLNWTIANERLDVINKVCKGVSFKGTQFNFRVNKVMSLRLFLRAVEKYAIRPLFLALIDPKTGLSELITLFGIREHPDRVNWQEAKPFEDAYERRRNSYRQWGDEDFYTHSKTSQKDTRQKSIHLTEEGWPTNEAWAYQNEAALHGYTYEQVLGIDSVVRAQELKKLYKTAMKLCHEDVIGSSEKNLQAVRTIAAYRVAKKVLNFK